MNLKKAACVMAVAIAATAGPAAAGPLVCAGTAAAAALGWLGYGIFRVATAPTLVVTAVGEVAAVTAAGAKTIELVTYACLAPTV